MDEVGLDAGPPVTTIGRGQRQGAGCVEMLQTLRDPLMTTEVVLTEACCLLGRRPMGAPAPRGQTSRADGG